MKIAAMSTDSGYIPRGANRTITEISKYLRKWGHEVDVYGPGDANGTIKVKTLARGTIGRTILDKFLKITRLRWLLFYIPLPLDELGMFSALFYLKLLMRGKKYDVVWTNTERMGCTYGRLYRFFTKTPIVSTGHSGGPSERYGLRENPDGWNAIDLKTWNLIQRHPDVLKNTIIKYIQSGVPLDTFTIDGKKLSESEIKNLAHKKNIKIERPIVICTAAIVKRKGIDKTIRAVAKMKKGTLILSSDGNERENLVKLGDELLGERFVYLGVLSDYNLARLNRTADVVTLMFEPNSESFGAIIAEGMACGTPVVTRNDSTRQHVVGDAGILINSDDPETYASALEKASVKKWNKNKIRNQAEKFSWEKAAKKYEDLFMEVRKKSHHII